MDSRNDYSDLDSEFEFGHEFKKDRIIAYNDIELKEYHTHTYIWLQTIAIIFCVFTFMTCYLCLYYLVAISEKLNAAKIIQF